MTSLKRAMAGVAGFVLLCTATFVSSGVVLLVPFAVLAVRAIRRRRGLTLTRGTAWLGAFGGVAIGGMIFVIVVILRLPAGTLARASQTFGTAYDSAMTESRKQPPPAWVERVAPGSAARQAAARTRPVSAVERAFGIWSGIVGGVLGLGFIAAILATLGWAATLLIAFALRGAWY